MKYFTEMRKELLVDLQLETSVRWKAGQLPAGIDEKCSNCGECKWIGFNLRKNKELVKGEKYTTFLKEGAILLTQKDFLQAVKAACPKV